MFDEYQEYYFLSSSYGKGVSDKQVYRLFITKVLSNFQYPKTLSINEIQQFILGTYKVEIPPTFIKEIIKEISGYGNEFRIKNESVYFDRLPKTIEFQTAEQQANVDSDTRLIFTSFNEYLEFNKHDKIAYDEFRKTFNVFCNLITRRDTEKTETARIMIDWINGVYKASRNETLVQALNKMVYSWLIYTYFYSVKRQKKALTGFSVVFDTNLLVYLLGINGSERKKYVEYLLLKLKLNNCRVVIHDYTINELNDLIDSGMNVSIRIFNNDQSQIHTQIKHNAEEYFKTLFAAYSIPVEIDSIQTRINTESDYYRSIYSDLRSFKTLRRPNIVDSSLYHDIMLVHSTGNLKKIANIYTDKKLIATCDTLLTVWFSKYLKQEFKSEYSLLLTLDKINLIFWMESDKAESSDFLANTWLYISETIGYFNDYAVDEYFKKVREQYNEKINVPDNWRSPYILIKDVIPTGKNLEDISEEELEKALDTINHEIFNENAALKTKLEQLEREFIQYRTTPAMIQSSEELNPVVNFSFPMQPNKPDDFTFLQLLFAIIKKIAKFISSKFIPN